MAVTNPLRTLVDLAGVEAPEGLAAAVDQGLSSRLVTVAGLTAEIDRLGGHGRAGVGILRRHLEDRGFTGVPPASVLEAKARRIVMSLPVAPPTFECHAGTDGEYRLDIAWPHLLFVVEVDGYAWHSTPEQIEYDNTRRDRLRDLGWTIRVYTWRQVAHHPARVGTQILATYRSLALR
jgi:hypothetical protein